MFLFSDPFAKFFGSLLIDRIIPAAGATINNNIQFLSTLPFAFKLVYHRIRTYVRKRGSMMELNEYQAWISEFYKKRNWYQYDSFIRANFLAEEVGEVSRAIRTIEIGRDRPDEESSDFPTQLENLTEELGDVLDNIVILADKYGISFQEIMSAHKQKLSQRYDV
jgi:NTP pyrophosphatase (non-canonical NTP hydrolase)